MIISISNGQVITKDIVTRGVRKAINKALYAEVEFNEEGKATKGFTPAALDRARDAAMVGMIEQIIINGVQQPVTVELIDSLEEKDVDLIIDAVNSLTQKKNPEEVALEVKEITE